MPWTPSLWHIGGPCQTGLGTLAWFARTFLDRDDPAATLDAAQAASAPEPPLFLPYLTGERMPWWTHHPSASFHNARAHPPRRDLPPSVPAGPALAHRLATGQLGARRPDTRR